MRDPVVRADRSGVGFLVNQTGRSLRRMLDAELQHLGLSHIDYLVLKNVELAHVRGEPLGAAALAAQLHIPAEEIAASAERLVRKGWLSGKLEALRLTDKALRHLPALQDAARWMLERALNGFSAAEIEALAGYLRRMLDNMA